MNTRSAAIAAALYEGSYPAPESAVLDAAFPARTDPAFAFTAVIDPS
jgi:hypothetical protein